MIIQIPLIRIECCQYMSVHLFTPCEISRCSFWKHVKFFKQFVIVKFKEFDNINDIERYKRCPLLVTRENAVPLEEDEYFVADMIGMKVITEDGTEFGTLSDVMETGANDVYVIDSKEHGEVLMPAIKECVLNVDMESGIITVHLMNGLI